MSSNDEVQLYNDLKGFLMADRADLRLAATQAVLQVRDQAGMEKIVEHGLLNLLAKNSSYPERPVAVNALQALVYLTSHGTTANKCVQDLMDAGGLNRMSEVVLSSMPSDNKEVVFWKKQVNLAMGLIANMTRIEAGAVELAGTTMPEQAVSSEELNEKGELPTKPTLELLLARFLNEKYVDEQIHFEDLGSGEALDSHHGDPYQHFAAVLTNATQVDAGQRFVMRIHRHKDEETSVLQKLLPVLRSPNPLRRRGIAGMLRNCCLDSDSSFWLIHVVKITKHLLYPLAGPEELDIDEKKGLDPDLWIEGPDKVREPDHFTRLALVESILLLCCTGRKNREQLRLERAYIILKWADMVEEHEDVSAQIEECVQFLRRDEEGTAEGSSDKMVADAYLKPTAAANVGATENFDDVD